MVNDIRVLEKIGLQEVCKKTHIEVKQLEYMINNQYDKLNKINTLGFVKILSREYKLDLTNWLEDFHDYLEEHKVDEDPTKEKIFIHVKSDRPYKKGAWLFLLIVLISIVFAVFSLFKTELNFDIMSFLDKAKTETNQTSAFQSAPVVQEAATSLGVKVEERLVVETNSSNSSIQAVVVSIDENLTRKTEMNTTAAGTIPPLPSVPSSNTTLTHTAKNSAIIMPTKRIWIGMINLDTFARKESISDQNMTIDLTKRQIFKTGNGFFKLSYDGSVEDFTEQGSTRFLVENGELKKISEEKFIELNRGKNW